MIPSTPRIEFWRGVQHTLPMIAGAIPFGIIFGAVAVNGDLSAAGTLGLSVFVFAGSSQFIAVGLLSQGASIALIVFTTLIVNLRHALYAASLAPYVKHLPQRWLIPLGFWLTDETYATTIAYYPKTDSPHRHWYQLGSSVAMYANWQLCTLVGVIAGTQLEGTSEWGLDFALVVTFIGIVVTMIVSRPMLICAITAGLVALAAHGLPNQLGLMVGALAGIMAGLAAEYRLSANNRIHQRLQADPMPESSESEVSHA